MITPLRILVVLPLYGGSLPIGRYCATALQTLGHTVEVFDAPAFFGGFQALKRLQVSMDRQESLETSLLQVLGQAIHAKVEAFQPQLVLAMAQAPVTRQLLKRLQRDNVTTAMWFVEDYRLFPYWRSLAPLYDFFFVIQREPFASALREIGAVGHYLPLAALPSVHRPVTLSPEEQARFGSPLSFLGAGYPNRRTAFRELGRTDLKVWGTEWEGEASLQSLVQEQGARIAPEDAVRIFNATTINLNLHSSILAEPPVQAGDFVNPRTFEIAACGGFQLVDQRALLPELFRTEPDTDQELVTFDSLASLKEQIAYYQTHDEERNILAARARARVLTDHTYAQRMTSLLQCIAATQPHWNAQDAPCFIDELKGLLESLSEDALPQELGIAHPLSHPDRPEQLEQPNQADQAKQPDRRSALLAESQQLVTRLGLPKSATFVDVVCRLETKTTPLDALETAILFLKAWKQQYRQS